MVSKTLTDDMPIILRSNPKPKDNAKASKIPIPIANSKAVDTEDSCFLSATPWKGFPLLLPSSEFFYVQKSAKLDTSLNFFSSMLLIKP